VRAKLRVNDDERSEGPETSAKQELEKSLGKYEPEVAAKARKAPAKLRKLVPGAVEMVYHNYNRLVIGYGPSEKASLAVFSIVVALLWVTLCFLQGAKLPDAGKRLSASCQIGALVGAG
jgi:hypothetical protein